MLSFAYLSMHNGLTSTGEAAPRLRDLIAGLRSGDIAAASILGLLDPTISDKIRGVVAHRGINMERFLADVLIAFALDIADETWRQAVCRRECVGESGQAGMLSDLLTEATHQMLQRSLPLAGEALNQEPPVTPGRRVG
jgi:hypothetical protein